MRRYSPRAKVRKAALQAICQGEKTLLVRTDDPIFVRFERKETVVIASGDRACTCRIVDIRRYEALDDLLNRENLARIAHGDRDEAHRYLSEIYDKVPPHQRFVVLELALVKIGKRRV